MNHLLSLCDFLLMSNENLEILDLSLFADHYSLFWITFIFLKFAILGFFYSPNAKLMGSCNTDRSA